MKLFFKITIPIGISFILFFSLLLNYIIVLEEKTISEFQNSVRTISQNEFENRKVKMLNMEEDYLDFISHLASKISFKYLYNYNQETIIKPLSEFVELKSIEAISIFDASNNENFITLIKDDNGAHVIDKLPDFFDTYKKFNKPIFEINEKGETETYGHITIYYNDFLVERKLDMQYKKILSTLEKSEKQNEQAVNKLFKNQTVLIFVIAGLLSIIVFFLIQRLVLLPLNKLQIGLNSFFLFLQNKKNSTQRIELNTSDEFGQMATSLNNNIVVSSKLHEEIHELNVNLEQMVEEKTQKVTTLLNNAGQGFLSFDNHFIIDEEYSKECIGIIGDNFVGKKISNLMFEDKEKQEFFQNVLLDTLNEDDEFVQDSLISLLPTSISLRDKAIEVEYKILEDNKFMLILTDITAQKILEKKIKEEQEILKMVVSVVTHKEIFFDLKNDFEEFCNEDFEYIDFIKTPLNNMNRLYRMVHTFKGTFLQLFMNESANQIHKIESSISQLIKNSNTTNEEILKFLKDIHFIGCIENDFKIIKKVLGENFINNENLITISKESIKNIELKIASFIDTQKVPDYHSRELLSSIQQLISINLMHMLSAYTKMSYQLSHKLEKEIYEFEIIGDDNLLIPESFKPFIKSLIHIFRNSADHGIESSQSRALNNKDQIGTISCNFEKDNNVLQIIIADDGQGIDTEKIKQKLLDRNIDVNKLEENDFFKYIFEDNFSTKEEITQISGRGVGMSVVKNELDKLNGSYEVQSTVNVGTTFIFKLPFYD